MRSLDFLLLNNGNVESASDDDGDSSGDEDEQRPKRRRLNESFGLFDDCPPFEGLSEYVRIVAGATLTACRALRDDRCDIAINWTGGRHHAQRSAAAGFCYISDIVLGINELRRNPSSLPPNRKKIDRVLYIDFDVHHGDGVEAAFAGSKTVRTLSIHLHAPLFFPSTGRLSGKLTGPLNVATRSGLNDESLLRLVDEVVLPALAKLDPDAVVMQQGVDGLAGDPVNEWNLSISGLGEAMRKILDVCGNRKVLLLGGGGYDSVNAARAWTYFTSIAVRRSSNHDEKAYSVSAVQLGRDLAVDSEIPTSIRHYRRFAPSFTLDVESGNRRDENTEEKLLKIEAAFAGFRT